MPSTAAGAGAEGAGASGAAAAGTAAAGAAAAGAGEAGAGALCGWVATAVAAPPPTWAAPPGQAPVAAPASSASTMGMG
jgi:hypothetical protein